MKGSIHPNFVELLVAIAKVAIQLIFRVFALFGWLLS
jgi:hypothetical protein